MLSKSIRISAQKYTTWNIKGVNTTQIHIHTHWQVHLGLQLFIIMFTSVLQLYWLFIHNDIFFCSKYKMICTVCPDNRQWNMLITEFWVSSNTFRCLSGIHLEWSILYNMKYLFVLTAMNRSIHIYRVIQLLDLTYNI